MINNMTKVIYSLTDFVKGLSHSYTVKAQAFRRVRSFHAPPPPPSSNFLDFNFLKSSFLGFWVIQTGYRPVPFSLNEALQIGGFFSQGQFPGSGYGGSESKPFSRFQLESLFLLKTYLLRKISQISDFSEYGARRVQTVFQISMVEAGVNQHIFPNEFFSNEIEVGATAIE